MSAFRTALRLPRFRNPLPNFRLQGTLGGLGVGGQLSGTQVAREAREALELDDLLKRTRDEAGGVVTSTVEGTDEVVVEERVRSAPPPIRRRGPATMLERRDRLDYALQQLAKPGAHVEFQANTIAVINPGNVIVRLLRFLLGLPLIPLRIIAHAIEWVFRPRGAGRLKRTVVFVDRRGNVVVYRM